MNQCISKGSYGVVSISPNASRIGVEVLEAGGNAVDAYIATQLATEAYEPGWTGLGGGGFALLYFNGGLHLLDYRETAPHNVDKHVYTEEDLRVGYKAVATPGMGRGLDELHKKYGELGLDYIVKHVLRHLEKGVRVSKLFSQSLYMFKTSFEKAAKHPYTRKLYNLGNGPPHVDMRIKLNNYLRLLKRISREGFEVLYSGFEADILLKDIEKGGGLITDEDLRRYRPIWRRVLKYKYGDNYVIFTSPPPSSGKLVVELLRRLKEAGDLNDKLEALKWIQDMRMLLQDPAIGIKHFYNAFRDLRSTAHFTVVDKDGNIVSATTTLECFMGSGVTVEGLDILLNDEMHDFNLDKGYNRLRGGVRPASSMAPTLVFKDGKPYLAIGASGGRRIFSALAQILHNHFNLGYDIVDSIYAKRIHYDPGRKAYLVEDVRDLDALRKIGVKNIVNTLEKYPSPYDNERSIMMGVAEAILFTDKELIGVSDPRKRCGAYMV